MVPCKKLFQRISLISARVHMHPNPHTRHGFGRVADSAQKPKTFGGIIERRARRYYDGCYLGKGTARLADSRAPASVTVSENCELFDWVITSPPYYGMRTYIPDQWLRNWFMGGIESVDYSCVGQVVHSSAESFATDLRIVWTNVANATRPSARTNSSLRRHIRSSCRTTRSIDIQS